MRRKKTAKPLKAKPRRKKTAKPLPTTSDAVAFCDGVDVVQIFDSWAGILSSGEFHIEPTAREQKVDDAKSASIRWKANMAQLEKVSGDEFLSPGKRTGQSYPVGLWQTRLWHLSLIEHKGKPRKKNKPYSEAHGAADDQADDDNHHTFDWYVRTIILGVLDRCKGNHAHAAKELGISIRTLRNKIKAYNADGANIAPGGSPYRSTYEVREVWPTADEFFRLIDLAFYAGGIDVLRGWLEDVEQLVKRRKGRPLGSGKFEHADYWLILEAYEAFRLANPPLSQRESITQTLDKYWEENKQFLGAPSDKKSVIERLMGRPWPPDVGAGI